MRKTFTYICIIIRISRSDWSRAVRIQNTDTRMTSYMLFKGADTRCNMACNIDGSFVAACVHPCNIARNWLVRAHTTQFVARNVAEEESICVQHVAGVDTFWNSTCCVTYWTRNKCSPYFSIFYTHYIILLVWMCCWSYTSTSNIPCLPSVPSYFTHNIHQNCSRVWVLYLKWIVPYPLSIYEPAIWYCNCVVFLFTASSNH